MSILKKIENAILVYKVHKNAGISFGEAKADMAETRANMGISFKKYFDHSMWELAEDDRIEFATKGALARYARQLSEFTGESLESSKKMLEQGKSDYGISYREYLSNSFFELGKKEREEKAKAIKEKSSHQEKVDSECVAKVAKETGWSENEARQKMQEARERCGAEFKNYLNYRFWEIDADTQDTYLNMSHIKKLIRKYTITPEKTVIFKSKVMFNRYFSKFTGREWLATTGITKDQFSEKFGNSKKLIYKPKEGSGGSGVRVFDRAKVSDEDIVKNLGELPSGIVEEFVEQHPDMAKLSGGSAVNTVRVISILDNSHCFIPCAVLRVGKEGSTVDNLFYNGVLGALDPETGRVIKPAIDRDGVRHEKLPNGLSLEGFAVPCWDEVRDMIDKAARVVPTVGLIGWDVAIMEKGPILIEGNTYPASNNIQLPYVPDHEGMRHVFDKFLK